MCSSVYPGYTYYLHPSYARAAYDSDLRMWVGCARIQSVSVTVTAA